MPTLWLSYAWADNQVRDVDLIVRELVQEFSFAVLPVPDVADQLGDDEDTVREHNERQARLTNVSRDASAQELRPDDMSSWATLTHVAWKRNR